MLYPVTFASSFVMASISCLTTAILFIALTSARLILPYLPICFPIRCKVDCSHPATLFINRFACCSNFEISAIRTTHKFFILFETIRAKQAIFVFAPSIRCIITLQIIFASFRHFVCYNFKLYIFTPLAIESNRPYSSACLFPYFVLHLITAL